MKLKGKNKNIDELLKKLGYGDIDDFSDGLIEEITHHMKKNASLILENGEQLIDIWENIIL